jgi:hypothetical protein
VYGCVEPRLAWAERLEAGTLLAVIEAMLSAPYCLLVVLEVVAKDCLEGWFV